MVLAELGSSGSGALMRLWLRCQPGFSRMKVRLGWRIQLWWLTHMAFGLSTYCLLAGGLRSLLPGYLCRVLTAWHLASSRASDERGREDTKIEPYGLVFTVTYYWSLLLYSICYKWVINSSPHSRVRELGPIS